jgi:hypothetical protein
VSRVFRKTALGVAAFAQKEGGLSAAQRAILVLVDGKRSASDLRRFGANFGDVNMILRTLYDSSLIELDANYVARMEVAQSEIREESNNMLAKALVDTMASNPPAPAPMPSPPLASAPAPQAATNAPLAQPPQKRDLSERASNQSKRSVESQREIAKK